MKELEEFSVKDLETELNKLEKWLTKDEIQKCLIHFQEKVENGILKFKSPKKDYVFNAFNELTPDNTKILIIGQDPYPDNTKATGFAFLLNKKVNENDSLYYILKAINNNENFKPKKFNRESEEEYIKWVKTNQVLLLNTALTHESSDDDKIRKHRNSWKPFIKQVLNKLLLEKLLKKDELIVYLWGEHSQNVFFQVLNSDKNFSKIRENILKSNNFPKDWKRQDGTRFKKGNTIKNKIISIDFPLKLTLFLHYHPSKINNMNKNGKENEKAFTCVEHFDDEIWKKLFEIYASNQEK